MPYYHMMGPYPFMGFGMGLIWLIFLIVVAYFVYKLIKSERILAPPSSSAENILAERYAKGELTRVQYVQMKGDLKKVQ